MFTLRLLIVDDHDFFRRSIMVPLEEETRIKIVGTASSGDQAVTLCRNLAPDVVLMDLNMPYLSGLAAIERIKPQERAPAILVLTGKDDMNSVADAFTAGAQGYLRKDMISDELLISAIFTVASGGVFVDDKTFNLLKSSMLANRARTMGKESPRLQLSPEEQALLRHVAIGYDNDEIGRRLQITAKTVSNRLSQLYLRIEVSNRVQAANFAFRHGIADLSEAL